jgi:hypothetical protein
VEPDEVPGSDIAPGVAFGLGVMQLPFDPIVSDELELLDVVLDVPALGDGHGDAFAVVV